MQKAFEKLYGPLFGGALVRCDFFVIDDEVYINEINPVPGSMANYLFDDFNSVILDLASSLPKQIDVPKTYKYIHHIQAAKGK